MKRSEMLQQIREKLLHVQIDQDNFEKQILDVVEKLGMLPPERYTGIDEKPADMTYGDWIQLPSRVNKWEKE